MTGLASLGALRHFAFLFHGWFGGLGFRTCRVSGIRVKNFRGLQEAEGFGVKGLKDEVSHRV